MKKIPTLYVRDENDRRYVTDEVTPGCEWVLNLEGVATRKYDGTCVMKLGDDWYARREVKPGRPEPEGFMLAEQDPNTGKAVGWIPMEQSDFRKWWREAVSNRAFLLADGTYELCGPKINGNPEGFAYHVLLSHELAEILPASPDPMLLIDLCRRDGLEGIVWHHPDGRMAKLKVRDFPDLL